MAYYSRLIAMELAPRHDLSNEYIEHLYLFAPLHDIGQLGLDALPDCQNDTQLGGRSPRVSRWRLRSGPEVPSPGGQHHPRPVQRQLS